ncbi:MAG: transporter substrate-binding domain-containing protein, partial [Firmicutes bacterium]|nr:transporter substrate-binding domain-containing protein [Bacillota bacterium]
MKKSIVRLIVCILIVSALVPLTVQGEAHALTTTVRVGYCDQMPPYQYTDADGLPKGFHVDVLEYIAEKEDLLLEYEAFGTTFEALDQLEEGSVDIVLGAAAGKYFDYNVRYSNPVSTANICLVAAAEIVPKYKNENKKTYTVVCEYQMASFSLLSSLTRGNAIVKGNQMAAVETLTEGDAEMIVGVKDCLLWYFQENEIDDDYIILNNYLDSADFTIAVRNSDKHLYDAVNKNIAVLRTSAEYEKLYNTWLAYDKGVDYQKVLKYVLYAVGICLIFLITYLIASYRAKQKLTELVEIRTSELNETNQKLERRTAQVEAENRLRYSIIEASPAGMVLVDELMQIEYMNSRALQIAGIQNFRRGEVLGRLRIFREILRDAGGIFTANWDYKAGSFEFYKDKEHRNREKYRYSIHKMTLSEGAQGALITLENVTAEEKEREAAFEKEKNETLNSLIAGIAHEIKNPLTAISASAAMIQEKGDNEKFRQAFSAFIPQEIDRVTRLINSLIDYARPSGSKIELVSLNEIILSVAELAKVTAKKIDISVEMDMAD